MVEKEKFVLAAGEHAYCDRCGDCVICFAEDGCFYGGGGKHVTVTEDDDA